ncbi:MAG: DUF433 domain-containing protein [Chloroflexi bacterium]|nr:DUF433 domain-containing protein [Chloroflexota bacterium]MBI3168029.1 DUF433 domain-containing protein [Chloroflexota bacterium]
MELKHLRLALQPVERTQSQPLAAHPYVESIASILSGEPIIKDTRTPVRAIVERWKFGEAAEEIARNLPHLRLAQIFDALGYYDDHREEIEKYIELNRVPVDD